jgi:hypothetical protein
VEVNGHGARQTAQWVSEISDDDWRRVQASLEAVAPEVTTAVQISCIGCGQESRVDIDPYVCLQHRHEAISHDIHTLACTYHWSEAEILALPKRRRQHYLRLIDRARGMTS